MNFHFRLQRFTRNALALLTCLLAFAAPGACKAAILDGIRLCGMQLLPALFPFFIVSSLLIGTGAVCRLGFFLSPLTRMFGVRAKAAPAVLLIGLCGGFAPAASAVGQLYRQRGLSREQAARLLPVCVCAAPSFTVLAVGGMLHSIPLGACIYAGQLFACLLCGVLLRLWCGAIPCAQECADVEETPTDDISLPQCIGDASVAFVRMAGIVLYFRFLCGGLSTLLPPPVSRLPVLLLEVSAASAQAAQMGRYAAYWCCAVLSLQSVSVLCQVRALVPPEVSLRPLLCARILHLPFSLLFLRICLFFFPAADVYSSLSPRVIPRMRCAPDAALMLFALCICACIQAQRALQRRRKDL